MPEERFSHLLDRAREGDEGAWSELFNSLAPIVLGYLRANGAPDPEDVLGETFLQVARDVSGFDGDEQGFRGWVFTIAHHRLIDARRRSARRPVELSPEPPEPSEVAEDAADAALERIGVERVAAVLQSLSDDQRTVLLLRIVGDLSIEQTARTLDKKPNAIKALQHRGLEAARRELSRRGVTR